MSEHAIATCPFCGSEPTVGETPDGDGWTVACTNFKCLMRPHVTAFEVEEAQAAWCKRAPVEPEFPLVDVTTAIAAVLAEREVCAQLVADMLKHDFDGGRISRAILARGEP